MGWRYLAADFLKAFAIDKIGTAIMLSLIVIITAVGITNTMVMVTFERTREIGTLMALGMRRFRVLRVFLWEGALLGAAGSLAGCVWGGLLTWYYEIHGISMKALYGNMKTPYPINDYMYSKLSLRSIGYILMFGVIISILASGLPALRASRQNPAEALRRR